MRISMASYMQPVPCVIYYIYDTNTYTSTEPDNTVDYDVYELQMNEYQQRFDKNPCDRKNFKHTPREVSIYHNPYENTSDIYLYWNDYKSSLYNQYVKTGKTSIDLALNESL